MIALTHLRHHPPLQVFDFLVDSGKTLNKVKWTAQAE